MRLNEILCLYRRKGGPELVVNTDVRQHLYRAKIYEIFCEHHEMTFGLNDLDFILTERWQKRSSSCGQDLLPANPQNCADHGASTPLHGGVLCN